jgi:hypothetical protein
MTSGDAYIYCAIIPKYRVEKINRILKEIQEIQAEIDLILMDMKIRPEQDTERGKKGLALIDEQNTMYDAIIDLCSNPIALSHVADDSWSEAYHNCSRYNFRPVPVKEFLKGVNGKLWKDPAVFDMPREGYCICLPSHYDDDEEFLEQLNVRHVWTEQGGKYQTPARQPYEPEFSMMYDPPV